MLSSMIMIKITNCNLFVQNNDSLHHNSINNLRRTICYKPKPSLKHYPSNSASCMKINSENSSYKQQKPNLLLKDVMTRNYVKMYGKWCTIGNLYLSTILYNYKNLIFRIFLYN